MLNRNSEDDSMEKLKDMRIQIRFQARRKLKTVPKTRQEALKRQCCSTVAERNCNPRHGFELTEARFAGHSDAQSRLLRDRCRGCVPVGGGKSSDRDRREHKDQVN